VSGARFRCTSVGPEMPTQREGLALATELLHSKYPGNEKREQRIPDEAYNSYLRMAG
jgi:hypothetical protein